MNYCNKSPTGVAGIAQMNEEDELTNYLAELPVLKFDEYNDNQDAIEALYRLTFGAVSHTA
jgi:hypothetical protein